MAYKEHGMWEILDVLRRRRRGESQAWIQAATGRSRVTIRRWLAIARALDWDPDEQEPDEDLARQILDRVRPGPKTSGPGETEQRLLPHLDQIRNWLDVEGPGKKRGLRLTKVHILLARQGVDVPYSSLHRFAVKYCRFGQKRMTVRMADVAPGELAEIDFGYLGLIPDPETGRRRKLWALIVTLVFSRHAYVHTTHSQKLADVIDGIEDAWEFFGGVPARVTPDNMRTAITRADRYDPVFQRTFEEYALQRGFIVDPTPPGSPTAKPHVERAVPYLRDSFFAGETWLDRDHVQREAIRWCLQTAGTRRHGTTQKSPLAVFEAVEKQALKPLAGDRFDTPAWAECKVHPDHHVQFQKALYSVSTQYLGKQVTVRGDRALVRVYHRGELIKTHPTQAPGGRCTDYEDYPQEKTAYAMRDPERLIRQARQQGTHIGRFAQALLAGTFPWAKLRQAQKLIRLADKYGAVRLDRACRRALAFDLINVRRLERIIHHALEGDTAAPTGEVQSLFDNPKFLRPAGSFTHPTQQEEEANDRN
jgi:transposase